MPTHITVEEFFRAPERTAATISPDGTRLAYLAPWRNRLNIWVQRLDTDEPARCVTADETRSVYIYRWTPDPRWLLYMQDTGGDENWHLYRIDLDDPSAPAVDLTPFPGTRADFEVLKGRPGKAIVQLNKRNPELFDAYELDIATGELTLLAENPGTVVGWLSSQTGELFTNTLTADGDVELSHWDPAAKALRPIKVYDGMGYPLGIHPIAVTPDGTGLWLGSNEGTDRTRLVRVDVATGAETEVDSHPSLELAAQLMLPSPLILSSRTGELIGARYYGERQVIHALDPEFADVLGALTALSDGDLAAISSDDSGRRWVVSFTDDRDPWATYLYDHATGEHRLLFRPYPHLDPEALAPMRPVTIESRDGLDLHGYLTLPVGTEQTNLPMVLLVHGGPWARDCWGYQPDVQLLANRGYAVLQVNFRGSTGYGKAFVQAAIGEFAGKMHDDLIDAVDWAVQRGIADRERVAIFGGSYGGYAALVGVTFTPDVFAAAIDYVGISSLPNFMRTLPNVARPFLANNWHRYVGDPSDPAQEADMLARSPITKVDAIRTPLLIAQGVNDSRVVQAESDNMVAALRACGVQVEYLVKDDEGHGFINPENQMDLYHAVERFLAKHL
ncbi:peptidase S9 prolyl oligopeptidase active site domain-containing protein [Mycolicibacterium canariasense]|uniref:Peptidase S9 prolyl oligopeptidase active site domain-containing protein n=1 Tax=Mycolicibacterium canariasense TaxID=228230 RepID=A0A117IBW6_MYCCR|nr:S9 family peptidase [Mycolicibacterium canariasense]MCV7212121.1 S9 family peptidase [Mycolicibacterium canariasense]ORU95246.1 peptidase [Mycolicibacterium canariasense]GAS98614.1 peptidase S9 prolyl oligopeptidase active site domain-containing protein [Mycolicibacterium canariasense]